MRKHIEEQPFPYTVDDIRANCLVDPMTGCWLWQGALNADGYARFGAGFAHRAVVQAYTGLPLPAGITVDHLCHNESPECDPAVCQHRRCCNPDHLRMVSHRDNILAAPHTRAGINARKQSCDRGHPLSGANLRLITGRGGRQRRRCLECERERLRRRYAALKERQGAKTVA